MGFNADNQVLLGKNIQRKQAKSRCRQKEEAGATGRKPTTQNPASGREYIRNNKNSTDLSVKMRKQ
jgi:hypothetical protein